MLESILPNRNFKYASLITALLTVTVASCKKDNLSIAGKWQEVKLHYYNQDKITGAISGDTTFQAAAFGKFDYAEFSSNGTCILSQGGLTYGGPQPLLVQDTRNYTYKRAGSGYALTEVFQTNGIINEVGTLDTVINITSNTLIIHSVSTYENPGVVYKTIGDAYYTKSL
jgi:hypothetical protein